MQIELIKRIKVHVSFTFTTNLKIRVFFGGGGTRTSAASSAMSLRPTPFVQKNDVLGFKICQKNDVLLNLACVYVHVL
jgi:hypothetical protein